MTPRLFSMPLGTITRTTTLIGTIVILMFYRRFSSLASSKYLYYNKFYYYYLFFFFFFLLLLLLFVVYVFKPALTRRVTGIPLRSPGLFKIFQLLLKVLWSGCSHLYLQFLSPFSGSLGAITIFPPNSSYAATCLLSKKPSE